jgi:hypothetical protein
MTPEMKAFIEQGLASMEFTVEVTGFLPRGTDTEWFMLLCTQCGDPAEPLWMPFESAEARGKWAAAHTELAHHDKYRVIDVPKGATTNG